MKIEIAGADDLDVINRIRLAVASDNSSGHDLSIIDKLEIEHNEERVTFICLMDSGVTGYITIYKTCLFCEENDVMLDVFVHPDFQGRGMGTKLIEACVKHASQATETNRIFLGVLNCNYGAISLYERHGFITFSEDAEGKYMVLKVQR